MFFIGKYSFFRTHREELIKFLAKHKHLYVACRMQKSFKPIKNVTFIDIKFSEATVNPFKILKDFIATFIVLLKSKEKQIFFVSPRIILIGIINSFFFSKKEFIFIFSGMGYIFINQNLITRIIRFLYLFSLKVSTQIFKSKCIVQNTDDYNFLISKGVKEERINIIHGNGINHRNFKLSVKKNNFERIKFLFVGRLLKDKGIIELLEASREIIKTYGDKVSIGIAGGSDKNNPASIDLDKLKEFYEEDRIKFHGKLDQEQVIKLYYEYSVFILPSYREGLPRSAIEASLSGMPLILSKVPGCKECLTNGYNGYFVKEKSKEDIVEKMEYFINNSKKISHMGVRSREFAIKKFSGDKIFNQYLKVLKV